MKKFEVGTEYTYMSSYCMQDFTVVKRTAKTVTFLSKALHTIKHSFFHEQHITKKIKVYDGVEYVTPFPNKGNVLSAYDVIEWEA